MSQLRGIRHRRGCAEVLPSARRPGFLYGTSSRGTSRWSASAVAKDGDTPSGSSDGPREDTRRKFERLMAARRTPVGASAARTAVSVDKHMGFQDNKVIARTSSAGGSQGAPDDANRNSWDCGCVIAHADGGTLGVVVVVG